MAAQITAAQVKQQLSALGYSIPDFMIDAYLCKLDGIRQCLEASGFTVKTGTSDFGHAFTQTRVTPRGIHWIAERYASELMAS